MIYIINMYYKIIANRPTYDITGSVGMDMKSDSDRGHNLFPYSVGDENGNPVANTFLFISIRILTPINLKVFYMTNLKLYYLIAENDT